MKVKLKEAKQSQKRTKRNKDTMKSKQILTLLFMIAYTLTAKNKAESATISKDGSNPEALPIIYIPGFLASCKTDSLTLFYKYLDPANKKNPHKNPFACVDYSKEINSVFTSMTKQATRACKHLTEISDVMNLRKGYILVGLSQGGLIARSIVQQCEIGQFAQKLLTFGSPQNGISRFPWVKGRSVFSWVNYMVEAGAYTNMCQNRVGPVGYMKLLDNYDNYLKFCKFLPKLNNEGPKKEEEYRLRMLNLKEFVMGRFMLDDVIQPNISSEFGYWTDKNEKGVMDMKETDSYKEDWIGLKTLDTTFRLRILHLKGGHLMFEPKEIEDSVLPYFAS